MRILLSAFACTPGAGSEGGAGWRYAELLAETHEVWVITDTSRRVLIERWEAARNNKRLRFIYYRPRIVAGLNLNSRTAQVIYQCWQMGAWRVARDLDRVVDFDFVWHLTYGVFRQPSWMWKIGKPFVFGPVGGAESAPFALFKGLPVRELFKECLREAVNRGVWLFPAVRELYRRADIIFVRTSETYEIIPGFAKSKVVIAQEIGALTRPDAIAGKRNGRREVKILFAGRLLGLKGIHLGLRAFSAYLSAGGLGTFTIIGAGPMERSLKELAIRLRIDDRVEFVGAKMQAELFSLYPNFDVLLFPSLHDSGGNVVLEALSFGLPVICLDLGGPKCFVDETCGIVIATRGLGVDGVVEALASSLLSLSQDDDRRFALSEGALKRAGELSWDRQINRIFDVIESRFNLAGKKGQGEVNLIG